MFPADFVIFTEEILNVCVVAILNMDFTTDESEGFRDVFRTDSNIFDEIV